MVRIRAALFNLPPLIYLRFTRTVVIDGYFPIPKPAVASSKPIYPDHYEARIQSDLLAALFRRRNC